MTQDRKNPSNTPKPDMPREDEVTPILAEGVPDFIFPAEPDLFEAVRRGEDAARKADDAIRVGNDAAPTSDDPVTSHEAALPASDNFDAAFDEFLGTTAAATARPDPATKAAHLRLAQENFAALQGSRDETRHMSDAPKGVWPNGLWQGVREMMNRLSTRGALTLTTAVVAGGFLVLSPQGRSLLLPPAPQDVQAIPATVNTAPEAAPALAEARMAPPMNTDAVEMEGASTATAPLATQAPAAAPPVGAAPATEAMAAEGLADAQNDDVMSDGVMSNAGAGAQRSVPQPPLPQQSVPQPPIIAPPPNVLTRVAPSAMMPHPAEVAPSTTDTYANAPAHGVQSVADTPVSTFSVDVDTASWSALRRSLNFSQLPAPEALRIEEMVNYFTYDYAPPAPDAEVPFAVHTALIATPWNADTQLLRIGLQGMVPAARPPLNLVFLIDTSGSMEDPSKLPLLTAALRLMLPELTPEDEVAIVTYAGQAGVALPPTAASDRAAITKALTTLTSGGGTAGAAGLTEAYALAASMRTEGEISRVILATDGDFNIGPSDPADLERLITKARDGGSYLSVLGFGPGVDDRTMQTLSQNGNGNAAYIDTLAEAQKVLVDELAGALFPIADDVKVQVEFNPATVAEYRLIGYETRALAREEFNDDRVDAGEIGAGHSVTALYEITPTGSPAVLTDPLRYQPEATVTDSDELAFLRLRWKAPGADDSQLIETPIANVVTEDSEAAFAAAIAGFGEILRGDGRTGTWTLEQAGDLAESHIGPDPFGYRREAVTLIDLAARLQD